MSQVSKYPIQKDVYDEIFDTFLQTIASLNTKREVLEFFNEFLTPTEKIMFSKRLAAGLLISEGYDYDILPRPYGRGFLFVFRGCPSAFNSSLSLRSQFS